MRLAFSTDIVKLLGLSSTILLDYLNIKIKETTDFIYDLPAIKIEKTKIISKNSDLFFVKPKDFSEALDNLIQKGLLIQFCKDKKKIKFYTINILNLLLLDLLQNSYFDFLHEVNDDYGYGYFVCCDEAFTPTGLFISDYYYTDSRIVNKLNSLTKDDIIMLIRVIYNSDLYNLNNWHCVLGDKFLPLKTINCAYPDKVFLKSFEHFDYYTSFYEFIISVAKGFITPKPDEIKRYKKEELKNNEVNLDNPQIYVKKENLQYQ